MDIALVASTDTAPSGEATSDPALTPFVTATEAEIAYAEELRRRIEKRYLNRQIQPGARHHVSGD